MDNGYKLRWYYSIRALSWQLENILPFQSKKQNNDKLLSEPASTKLGYYSSFRIRSAELSNEGTENVAIYALSSGKFLDARK